jgi:hypothetical protein
MVQFQIINTSTSVLTAEGVEIATNGSHEARVWAALPLKGQGEPMTVPDLQVCNAFLPASAVLINAKVCLSGVSRRLWDLILPRSVKARLSRTSGSRRKELVSSRLYVGFGFKFQPT